MTKYSIGDIFTPKGCRDYDTFEINNIVVEDAEVVYTLKGLKWGVEYKVIESTIDSFWFNCNKIFKTDE